MPHSKNNLLLTAIFLCNLLAPASSLANEDADIRTLPGSLDSTEMFNSNSPEVVKGTGILVSTFPPTNKEHPEAHLNHQLNGAVNFFIHHINNRVDERDAQTVYIGIIVYNPSKKKATIKVLTAGSNLSQPDAPFIALPALENNDQGNIFAGPGDRTMSQIMRGERDDKEFKSKIEIEPNHYALILNQPIPVDSLNPPINGRSALVKVETDEPIYAASLSSLQNNKEQAPSLARWKQILQSSKLVEPREKPATEPGKVNGIVYGRVAGVQTGSVWSAEITNDKDSKYFDLSETPKEIHFPIATLAGHDFKLGQIQSAPLKVRNSDTAYLANGNYGVHYSLRIPLRNLTATEHQVTIKFQNPSSDSKDNFYFTSTPGTRVFYRGSIRVTSGETEKPEIHFLHLVLHQGERGPVIFSKKLAANQSENVHLDFYYPPDATPPQVVTLEWN